MGFNSGFKGLTKFLIFTTLVIYRKACLTVMYQCAAQAPENKLIVNGELKRMKKDGCGSFINNSQQPRRKVGKKFEFRAPACKQNFMNKSRKERRK